MKPSVITLLGLLFSLAVLQSFSQDYPYQKGLKPEPLTPSELFVLSNIPLLELPEAYKGSDAPLLPSAVDNSTQPYFRPITWQSGYECGQSAGIAFNFTYEIDRLRGIPASIPNNQYPTHFTWDFLNNANNYQGVSFFDSWEIVRTCGNMNITDYGGALGTGGYTRWISGYDKYYNGMSNRLRSVKAIRVDTPEGLQTLKYWLYDHLEGSTVGGVANIYAKYFSPPVATLPAGTPEAGKYVQTFWGSSPSHAWTICGFNDSIRYDFNGDGQYTNHLDITNDGVVDMHDWEIGGLKFANGYAGTGWCNSGFCYTMYKNLADDITNGGIWNHSVYILDVQATCAPKLTMKITLKHTARNKIRVTAGINTNLSATSPSYICEYPIFNYQGGALYMQGGTTEADKTIEFGFDLTPLINQVNSSQAVKYFLKVDENDPSGASGGEIVSWSLIDYTTATPVITNYTGGNTPIANNTTTLLSMNYTLNFVKPSITTNSLPPAQLYQPYSATLSATSGTAPYHWDVKLDYPETTYPGPLPMATAQQLSLTNNNTGYAVKTLDFDFPYFKRFVNKLYIYADGYILFDDQPYTYPYLIDPKLLFRQTSIIAPFMTDMAVYPSSAQGIWYEGNAGYAIIRWKTSLSGQQSGTELNFAVKIYPNGTIEYYYGTMNFPAGTGWTGGISSGDNKNFQLSALSGGAVTASTVDKFTTCMYPPEMTISEDGQFTGTPTRSYQNVPVKFLVTDIDNLSSTKTLMFNTVGLLVAQTVVSGGDSLIEYGDTAFMTLNISNIGSQPLNNINFRLRCQDPYITVTDSLEVLTVINGGQNLTLQDAFRFVVSPLVPDNHPFMLTLHVQSQEHIFQRPLEMVAWAPVFQVQTARLDDGDNGVPDAGESADLLITYLNAGGAKASGITFNLTSLDPNLVVNNGTSTAALLKPDSIATAVYHVTAGENTPARHFFKMGALATASLNYTANDTLYLFAGEIIEDFETGDMTRFPWTTGGNAAWLMEPTVRYEGNYSIRTGYIGDNMESVFSLNAHVLAAGEMSFYKYVSCEQDPSGNHEYDYLVFMIDDVEMGRWDGIIPWSLETFPVTPGYHQFSWIYHKDYSVSANWDGALLDFIKLPPIEGGIPEIAVSPLSFEQTIQPGQTYNDLLTVTNNGGSILNYSVVVFDTTGLFFERVSDNVSGSWVTCGSEGLTAGQPFNWMFTVHNQSVDNENIEHIKIDLPPGTDVSAATNFTGGSLGELIFSGTPGQAPSLLWHGETTGGSGVLKPGESASATLTGTISEGFINDVFAVYDLRGDSAGAPAHAIPGSVRIKNWGLPNTWLSLANSSGSVRYGQSGQVGLTMNATGMSPGTYTCSLIARDGYNNRDVIPVTMHIPFPVSAGEEQPLVRTALISAAPNPVKTGTRINFSLALHGDVSVTIRSMQGVQVASWTMEDLEAGDHHLLWNGAGNNGTMLPPGVYACTMETENYRGSLKLILIR
jgi:hypothetical protein